MKISIAGLDKAAVLAALYNASRPQGIGFMQYDPEPMTTEEASAILNGRAYGTYFDYLKGRVMKLDLAPDDVFVDMYDRDNGPGSAERAINSVRNNAGVNSQEIKDQHASGKSAAAAELSAALAEAEPTKMEDGVITLGLAEVADKVSAALAKAMKAEEK